MNINYEYYRIFYYVGKYKNLTQAAEVLHNNQPNISRTIKLLEHEMGCKLLIRSNRGISLTPEGERLYAHVKTAVEQIQSAEEEITKSVNMQAGSVTIGASETALRMLVLPVLSIFKKHYPDIRIRILNHLTTQAIESVKKGMVDFAVVATPAMIEKPLISYPIWKLKDIVIGGTSYEKLSNRILTIEELAAYPLICLGETTMTYQLYDAFYHKHNLVLKPELEAATTDQILPMVKNDLGVAYIPEIFAKEALENKEVYRLHLAEEIPERQLCFVENQRFPLSIAAKELKALILDYTK
ncbi:MAG: LysR family transcriptional regulator [Lachnospiraceae bacterium]|nr:LysR family transcriptional regulator [Lachnospiraceae bacterium]